MASNVQKRDLCEDCNKETWPRMRVRGGGFPEKAFFFFFFHPESLRDSNLVKILSS